MERPIEETDIVRGVLSPGLSSIRRVIQDLRCFIWIGARRTEAISSIRGIERGIGKGHARWRNGERVIRPRHPAVCAEPRKDRTSCPVAQVLAVISTDSRGIDEMTFSEREYARMKQFPLCVCRTDQEKHEEKSKQTRFFIRETHLGTYPRTAGIRC